MTISALLALLVSVLTVAITVDKFLHTFGLSKLIAAQVRHLPDGIVEKAKQTPDVKDDEFAAALKELAGKAADAFERGDELALAEATKGIVAAHAAQK